MAPYPVHPIVRPVHWISRDQAFPGCGVQSLLIPYVQNVEEAQLASVAYARKIRGFAGITRASRYGTIPNYAKGAREEICLMVQIETQEALEQLEAIAQVPGVDAVFIGPADLAASMGYPGTAIQSQRSLLGGNEEDSSSGQTSRISNVGSGVPARDRRGWLSVPSGGHRLCDPAPRSGRSVYEMDIQ